MKYIKTFENLEDELELYDYVICEEILKNKDNL